MSWRDRLPSWLGEATFQAALIVLSLLLALAADEWRDRRTRRERMEASLTAIREELARNRVAAGRAARHHRTVVDSLRALEPLPVAQRRGRFPPNILGSADVVRTAWESAQLGGTVPDMPPALVMTLSEAYEQQATYVRMREALLGTFYQRFLEVGYLHVTEQPGEAAGIINDLRGWEAGLEQRYGRAIAALDSTRRITR